MPDRQKKTVVSFFPTSQPSNTAPKPLKISAENFDQALETGILYSGTLDNEQVAFIPADLRPLLQKILE